MPLMNPSTGSFATSISACSGFGTGSKRKWASTSGAATTARSAPFEPWLSDAGGVQSELSNRAPGGRRSPVILGPKKPGRSKARTKSMKVFKGAYKELGATDQIAKGPELVTRLNRALLVRRPSRRRVILRCDQEISKRKARRAVCGVVQSTSPRFQPATRQWRFTRHGLRPGSRR